MKNKSRKIIIHCSESGYGNAIIIDGWHRARGFDNIGYHFVILNNRPFEWMDGTIETGREIEKAGAHCKGQNEAIGICLIGESGKFTPKQYESLKALLKRLHDKYLIEDIYQHSDFDDKKSFCAGISDAKFAELRGHVYG
jgi:N-acetylmuramoyl-L-alanine amidase